MKKLLMTLAACATTLLASAAIKTSEGFEGADLGGFSGTGGSAVAYGTDTKPTPANYPFADAGLKYCEIDADGNDALVSPAATGATYFDMYIQFPANASEPDPDVDGAKLAVYVNSETNLVVLSGDGNGATVTNVTGTTIAPGAWKRLTIAKVEGGYQVYVDGEAVSNDTYPSIDPNDAAPSQASFTGCGKLDNFVARTTNPFETYNIALTAAPSSYTTKYQIGEADPVSMTAGDTVNLTIPGFDPDQAVKLLVANDNLVKEITAQISGTTIAADGTGTTIGWSDYLGDAVAGAYTIDDANDLDMLRKGVAAGLSTTDETFKQTADIDMTSAGAFAGIGTFQKVPTAGTPFLGTYNGQGYMIKNVTRAGGNTQGIFNQVGVSGVIENLVVSNMVFDADVTGEYGFAIVGNAGGGATLRNLTAAGVFGAADKASTHNMAGIVVRVCGGATAGVTTTIESCTNNATIYGGYTKLGGICAIVQQQTGFTAGGVAFINCANNGTLVCTRTYADCHPVGKDAAPVTGNAGIIGYTSASNVELTGCSGMGTITNTNGANTDRDAALIGWQYTGYTLKDNGGNSAPADTKMIAYYGNVANVTGFQYATVDNGVATTIAPPYTLAADNTYLLEGNVAAGTVYTFDAAGTIAFNTNGYTFAGTVAAADDLILSDATVDSVTTYTAVQAVAKIGDTKYATLAEAVEDFEDGDVIEFLSAPASGDLAVLKGDGTTIKFKLDTNYVATFYALRAASGYSSSQMYFLPDADNAEYVAFDVSEIAQVAQLTHDGQSTWYPTVEAAYGNAASGDSLLINLEDNFSVAGTTWASGDKALDTITFVNTTESALTVDTYTTPGSGVYYYLKAANWVAPANVTLKLYTQTVTSINAGTLNVPAGVTLTLAGESAIDNVSALTGTGVVSLPYGKAPSSVVQALCQANGWEGTLVINGTDIGSSAGLGRFGNSKSTVRFNNCGLTLANTGNGVKALEIASGGLELMGEYYQGSFAFPCALTGTGAITVSVKNSPSGSATKVLNFTGDTSGFTGSISFGSAANARVVFGSGSYPSMATATDNRQIVVLSDMTLPSTATWNAPSGVYVYGGLDVQGTLTVPEKGLYGSGVVKFRNKDKAVKVSDDWTGTYRIAWTVPTGAFVIGDYGRSASGTIEIMENINGAYPATAASGGTSPSVVPTLKLSANWTINDGWGTTTTFAKLTGSGNLTVNGKTSTGSTDVPYTITRLEGYTGTLGGVRGKFKIGTIVAAEEPVAGTKLVKLASSTRAFTDLDQTVVVYNNATVEGITLEQKDDGIYVAVPVTPGIDPSQGATVDVDTTQSEADQRAEAQTKADAMDVVKTAAASGVDQATWNGYFTKSVEKVDDNWVATATLNPAVVLPVDGVEETPLTGMLESVTEAALDTKKDAASVPTKAGLYYWIAGATEVGATTYTPGTAQLGDGTTIELAMPVLSGENGKAFYKVCVDLEAPVTAP